MAVDGCRPGGLHHGSIRNDQAPQSLSRPGAPSRLMAFESYHAMFNQRLELNRKAVLDKRAATVLIVACLLLLIQATAWMRTRWVEDESWMSNGAWTLLKEGSLRMPIFPADTRYYADVSLPLERLTILPVFAAFGL